MHVQYMDEGKRVVRGSEGGGSEGERGTWGSEGGKGEWGSEGGQYGGRDRGNGESYSLDGYAISLCRLSHVHQPLFSKIQLRLNIIIASLSIDDKIWYGIAQ